MNIKIISSFPYEYAFANLFLHSSSYPLRVGPKLRIVGQRDDTFPISVHITQLPSERLHQVAA